MADRSLAYYGLGVRSPGSSPAIVEEIEEASGRLEALTLFGCGLTSLGGLPPLRHLTSLALGSNALGPDLGAVFPEAAVWARSLTFLDVSGNDLTSLRCAGTFPALRSLDASENRLPSLDGLGAACPALVSLDVHNEGQAFRVVE